MNNDHSWVKSDGPKLEKGHDDFEYFVCSKCDVCAMRFLRTNNFHYYDRSQGSITNPICSEEQVRNVLDE